MKYVYWPLLPHTRNQVEISHPAGVSIKTSVWWRHHKGSGWMPLSFSRLVLAKACQEAGLVTFDQQSSQNLYATLSSRSRLSRSRLSGSNSDSNLFARFDKSKKTGGRRRSPDSN